MIQGQKQWNKGRVGFAPVNSVTLREVAMKNIKNSHNDEAFT